MKEVNDHGMKETEHGKLFEFETTIEREDSGNRICGLSSASKMLVGDEDKTIPSNTHTERELQKKWRPERRHIVRVQCEL